MLLLLRWIVMRRLKWIFLYLHRPMLLHLLHLLLVLVHLLPHLTGIKTCLIALILCLLISSSCDKIIKMIFAFYLRSKIDDYAPCLTSKVDDYTPCLRRKITDLERSWLNKLTWHNSCDLGFILNCSSSTLLFLSWFLFWISFCFFLMLLFCFGF